MPLKTKMKPIITTLKNGEELIVRKAALNDSDQLLDTIKANLIDANYFTTSFEEFNMTVSELKMLLLSYKLSTVHLYLIAEINGKIAGSLSFRGNSRSRTSHCGEMGIGIRKEYRGKGIGSFMTKCLLDWATQHSTIDRVQASVFSTNDASFNLLKRMGFTQDGIQNHGIKLDDGHYVDNILMSRWVGKKDFPIGQH